MKSETSSSCCEKSRCAVSTAYIIGILGSFLVVCLLARIMVHHDGPQAVDTKRAAQRAKDAGDLRMASTDALNTYGWENKDKGIVRLPIERALQIGLQEWKNPSQARSNMISRAEKANAVAPAKPNPYD